MAQPASQQFEGTCPCNGDNPLCPICLREIREEKPDIVVTPTDGPRSMRFEACVRGTEDADWDGDHYVATYKRGFGQTEQEAIDDLMEQLEEGK